MKKIIIKNLRKGEEYNIGVKKYNYYITLFEKNNRLYINHMGKKIALKRLYQILDQQYKKSKKPIIREN